MGNYLSNALWSFYGDHCTLPHFEIILNISYMFFLQFSFLHAHLRPLNFIRSFTFNLNQLTTSLVCLKLTPSFSNIHSFDRPSNCIWKITSVIFWDESAGKDGIGCWKVEGFVLEGRNCDSFELIHLMISKLVIPSSPSLSFSSV